MSDIFEIHKQIDSLPKGNIYKKKIKGKTYFYHQFYDGKIRKTKLIKNNELLDLKEKISLRLKLEIELKNILEKGNKNISLSAFAKAYTGSVMLRDRVVATFLNGVLTSVNKKLCPLIILRTNSIEAFLRTRVIDSSRTNSRILKKILNLNNYEDEKISLCNYSTSISDDYWFKPLKSKLKFKDISLHNNLFFDTSLKGIISIYPKKARRSPDLTTTGSYEKSWKNINGDWWLYKKENENEMFSELLYSNLFIEMKIPTVKYEISDGYMRCKNFAKKYNFEPLISIVGENEAYDFIYEKLSKIQKKIGESYLLLIFFDVCFNNIDRHNENCGILRDKKNGKIISLAPNFDNNISFISRNENLDISVKEGFLNYFVNYLKNNDYIKSIYKTLKIPCLNEKIILKALNKIQIKKDSDLIIKFILNRYDYLCNFIKN